MMREGKGNPRQVRLIEEEEELVEGEAFVGFLADTRVLAWKVQVWVTASENLWLEVWLA